MVHQRTRDLYFAALAPLLKLNHWRWKLQHRIMGTPGKLHLHLGCGPKYLPGFINIDGNLFRKVDRCLDLRNGLPFRTGSVASIYSSHVFEHLYPDELARLLCECHRVLRPGGGLRVVVPDMQAGVEAYVAGRKEFFSDFPRAHRSLGGKLSNLLFCEGGHRQGLDFSYLEELLRDAGFVEVVRLSGVESQFYPLDHFTRLAEEEAGMASYSLFVEALKGSA